MVSLKSGGQFNGSINLLNGATVDKYQINGKDHIFTIGSGKVTIANINSNNVNTYVVVGDNEYINGIAYNRSVDDDYSSKEQQYTITGTSGNDYINYWYHEKATINARNGDDYIVASNYGEYGEYGERIVNGELGNDTIRTYIDTSTISGGGGNNLIQSFGGRKVSISGGEGNDIIEIQATNEQFTYSYVSSDGYS